MLYGFLGHVQLSTEYSVTQIASLQKNYILPLHQSKKLLVSDAQ
jgi:hypothetical protein